MAEPTPTEVSPWYLRNINQALALDSATGTVYVRTNAELIGNVTVGNVGITALGNIDISGNTLPVTVESGNVNAVVTGSVISTLSGNLAGITGNVTIVDGGGSITVDGTVNAVVTGSVTATLSGNLAGITGNVTVVDGGGSITVDGTVNAVITGGNANVVMSGQNPAYLSAFEEPLAVTITPVIQDSAVYGLDPADWVTTELNNGNVSVNTNSVWQVASGTSAGGYARLATGKYMTYHPGQGSMFRWTAAFTTTGGTDKNALGIDNIVQNSGPIDREDGYSIGYSGSTVDNSSRKIGFLHRRNGSAEIRQLTVTVAPTGAQTATVTLNGVAFTVNLTASASTQYTAKQIANSLNANAVASQLWDIEACGSIVTFIYYSPGAKSGIYSFSSAGTGTLAIAAFSQFVEGVTPTDVWTYVGSWDNQSITFDPTKLNVFGLDMRWLGAGIVRLFMEDPTTGNMVLLHTQQWSSSSVVPHLNKPSLRLTYRSGTTNAAVTPSQNVVVSGSSVFAGIQGVITQTTASQSYYALDNTTRAKDLAHHLLSIQNPLTRGTDVNKSSLVLQDLSISCQGNDPSVVYVIKNAVGTSDLLVFNPIPNSSSFKFGQYSISSVTEDLSLDSIALVQSLGINGSAQFVLTSYNVTLSPGDSVSFFISSTNAITKTSIGIAWKID